ncbi:MAG: ABC transporter ATP-binding protein, partial [Planctomycetes bacterium]|nr:ABC transporter ATP-binding protein [Planctomycetota bacterium]
MTTTAIATETVVSVRDLYTHFKTAEGVARAVDGVSFNIKPGETFAIVGESGCGKSVTAYSIMQLVQKPAGFHPHGEIILNSERIKNFDILKMSEREKREMRGGEVAMIFQEPMTSLNPVFTIGHQISEAVVLHQDVSWKDAWDISIEMIQKVGIPDPAQRVKEYPHQLSGGMKQRAMIAMALSCKPSLLIADEPTTALDVTIQAQILSLMKELQEEMGMSILLITHDLGVVCEMADRVGVMYAGKIVEKASKEVLFSNPQHPYSLKLFQSLPDIDKRGQKL